MVKSILEEEALCSDIYPGSILALELTEIPDRSDDSSTESTLFSGS